MSSEAGVHEKGTFSLLDAIRRAKGRDNFQKAGAIAVFVGVVRGEEEKRENVRKLIIEAYEEKANEVLANICKDLKSREGITDVQIHHLLGEFEVGEDLVYVLVAGSHREDVFPILKEAVERYKKEAPIFKKEETVTKEGEKKAYWIAERDGQEQ